MPLLQQFARMTQHTSVGTSTSAVAMTGLTGCATFGASGAVDFVAAASIAATAMLGAGFGARLTSRFSGVQLGRSVVLPLRALRAAARCPD